MIGTLGTVSYDHDSVTITDPDEKITGTWVFTAVTEKEMIKVKLLIRMIQKSKIRTQKILL